MSDNQPATIDETFEAMCRIANAKRKLRESAGLFDAMMRKRDGAQVNIKHCVGCGLSTHHDVWSTFEGGDKREHNRCQNCGKHTTY